jgi:hypothetical protein
MEHIQIWEISPTKYEIDISETPTLLLKKYGIGTRAQWHLELIVPGEIMGATLCKFKSEEEAFAFFAQK